MDPNGPLLLYLFIITLTGFPNFIMEIHDKLVVNDQLCKIKEEKKRKSIQRFTWWAFNQKEKPLL